MSLNDFEILQKLGNEEKSSIFKVKRKKDGLIYILKTVRSQSLDKSEKQNVINEIKTVSSLSHANIIEFKEAFFDKFSKSLNIIFEFPHNGNLSNKINYAIKNKMYMEESIIWDVLVQILNGVNYLHKKGIVHRNLKSKIILLNNQRLVKISDFEASCSFDKNNNMITDQVGTPFYTAPEIWEEEPYNYKCDIWSIGCIIYEMASLTLPFKGDTINSLYENIMSKKIKPIPDFYSEDLKKIINYMLIYDPSKRPSTDLLLNYPKIKEESAKLKDIYIKYKNNKNSSNSKNKVNTQIIKEITTDSSLNNTNRDSNSSLKKPVKEKPQFNESLKNQNIYSKAIFPENASNIIKKDIHDLYKNNLKKVIKTSIYRTLRERKEPNFVENKLKRSKCHSKRKGSNSFNEFSNISTSRMQVPSLNQINKKVGLSSYSMKDTDINSYLSSNNKLKNNLISLTPNLDNNDEIIEENEGENDYKPYLTSINNTNNISKIRTPSENKGRDILKKSPSIRVNNISNNIPKINIIDNYFINNGNMTNKSNKKIIRNYTNTNTQRDNVNLDYNEKAYNRTLTNENVLISIKAKKGYIDNDFPGFKDNNVSATDRIKINDSFLKGNNKLDNGNSGNHSQLKMSSNNIVKLKKPEPKYQSNNNIDTNNISKKRQYTRIYSTLPNNSNIGENLSGITNLKNTSNLSFHLDKFINKNPINFNQCQILSNNNKVVRYKNNLLDFKFDNKVNSYIMEINNTNYLQECEDISLNIPENINHSKLNKINKLK